MLRSAYVCLAVALKKLCHANNAFVELLRFATFGFRSAPFSQAICPISAQISTFCYVLYAEFFIFFFFLAFFFIFLYFEIFYFNSK